MRRLLPALLLALVGCAEPDAPRVEHTRQSVLIFPDGGPRATGTAIGARLGTSITACPNGGWVAAAPGDDSMWVSAQQMRMRSTRLAPLGVDPLPVACIGDNGSRHMLMGGPNNTFVVFPDGGSSSVYSSRADSFAISNAFIAVGNTNLGYFTIFPKTTTTALSNPTFVSSPPIIYGIGNSLSWSSRGDLLVGNLMAKSVSLWAAVNADGGRVAAQDFLPNPNPSTTSDFGRVVLVGDVAPDTDEEYVVAAPAIGEVYVYSGTRLIDTISGDTSFGASLALEPTSFGGMHALWIGEPAANTVHRYFLGRLTSFPSPPEGLGASFGAAIAVDQRNIVAIGAPGYDDGLLLGAGAVFEATFDAGPTTGQMTPCVSSRTCPLPGCTTGVCINGTFCQQVDPIGSDCLANERCELNLNLCVPIDAGLPDAGARDAGPPDAGTPDAGAEDAGAAPDAGPPDAGPDAGAPDAGPSDAGTEDAGIDKPDAGVEPLVFQTSGCTAVPFPLLLVALVFFRRRVTSR